jgi:zinc/manganese transport system permease protein
VLSVVIALAVTWLGLALAYFSVYPVGFYVTSLAFALYVFVRVARTLAGRVQAVAPTPAEAV